MALRRSTTLGLLWVVLLAGVSPSLAQQPGRAAAGDTLPVPILVELRLDRIAARTVQAFQRRTEVLVPLTQFLQLAEVRYRMSGEGRLEATIDPGAVRLVIDLQSDTMRFGDHRVRLEREYRLFRDGELYVGAERLGDLLGSGFVVDWSELSVTLLDPSVLPIARRLQRDAAREALLHPRAGVHPDLVLGYERPRWDGLVFDYSFLAPSGSPLAGGAYTAALGADVAGGSLELATSSIGPAGDGVTRVDASWTGVWRDTRWLQQLRLGDGGSTGPRVRPVRGFAITNAPFTRPSFVGSIRYEGSVEPGGGWSVEAYRGGEILAFDSADAAGRFALDLLVRYGENPVDFVAYGPFGEIREFGRTYRVIEELLPRGRFEYGLSGGSCRSSICTATGNLDLRYGAAERWTVQAGIDQFWRDTLPNRFHPYASVAGSPINAWTTTLEAAVGAFARGGLRYEPSLDLRVTADYTRFAGDTVVPVLTPAGVRSRLSLSGFVRPQRSRGFFFVDGSFDRATSDLTTTTQLRLELSAQPHDVRLLPYLRVAQDAPRAGPSATHAFVGLNSFVLPHPGWGPVVGRIWASTGVELETDGGPLLQSYSVRLARQFGRAWRLEVGTAWSRGLPGATWSLGLTSNLPMLRSYTTVSAGGGSPAVGTQYVQGSVLWDRATARLALAPGPSLERSGISGRVFMDENGNGVADPGEPGIPGVRVRVGTSTAVSDSDGVVRVWDVVPFEPVPVVVDSLSLASPLLVPAFATAVLEPGPNRFRRLDIPIERAGVIEGRVLRTAAGRLPPQGVGGVTLALTDRRTGARRSFVTFSDGAFYAMGVKPGDYELTVDPRVLDVLNATAAPLRVTLTPGVSGVGAAGLEITLTPKP
ncbi:MAG TPA: hypothetical protein VEM13_07485 [Gemmatimonadales bacterium]|nr:hypothetical protein [Gemmatimonadales bacterium]